MKTKLNKVISTCLAAVMLLSAVVVAPITASSAETQAVSTGETISGDFKYTILGDGTAKITRYTGSATELAIPSELDGKSVTSIGNSAFWNCASLENVTIPDSVTSIGEDAFSGCRSLTSVTIPNSVTSIGEDAFWLCTSLTSITIPDSVTEIGGSAFEDCTSLASITIPDSVTKIKSRVFENTAWYDNQPDGVVYAGKVLYEYKGEMPQNTTITVKDGTKAIGNYAFYNCTSLASVTIPDSVAEIGYGAFFGCTNLTSVTIPNSITEISDSAFSGCMSLASVTIPDSVTSIGKDAFWGCTSLTDVTIPDSVTYIGWDAFYNCAKLTSITIHGETVSRPKLRYDYVCCNVCNKCLKPMMYKYGRTFNNEEIATHMFREHGGGSWHFSYHWFYVDDNGIYHDLSDDWKLPNVNYGDNENPPADKYWDEGSMNVFDVGFNPYYGALALDIYNIEHEDKLDYYWTTEIRSRCEDCNYDGSSIFDEWGGCGNQIIGDDGRPLFLMLTEPVEITYYPDNVADMTALDNARNTAEQAVADHKAWHKKQNNLPDYLNGNATTPIYYHDRIYTTVKTTTEPTTTEPTTTEPTTEPTTAEPETEPTTEPTEPITEPATNPDEKVLLGDANADGKVNIKDATTIQKSAASIVTLTDGQNKAADVNGDGKVNVNDATAIQKFTAGIDTGFEIGK